MPHLINQLIAKTAQLEYAANQQNDTILALTLNSILKRLCEYWWEVETTHNMDENTTSSILFDARRIARQLATIENEHLNHDLAPF
jgi:ATP-dependent protease HslVU (ClpYQ) ATPase subunit